VSEDPVQIRLAQQGDPRDPDDESLERLAVALVNDWVATVFRPFPSAGDLDRLAAAVVDALKRATRGADARVAALAGAVERTAREIHGGRHAGLFEHCADPPCPALRDALAPLLAPSPEAGRGPGTPQPS
jgi:hypothetical protein